MNRMDRRAFLGRAGMGMVGAAVGVGAMGQGRVWGQAGDKRPNIVVILADDMGYSDLGSYGGEIETPALNGLAAKGLRFKQSYNTARCCPTRASLMTGLHPHQGGIGWMTRSPESPEKFDWGTDGYHGVLNRNCVTIAEVMKEAGYHTYMVGKWHLGFDAKEQWPLQRGFERYYGILSGACNYYRPGGKRGLTLDNEMVQPEGEDYYVTDAFTDHAIEFVEGQEDSRPFFMYVAYNSPHWPLHAKAEDVAKYRGKYKKGWDVLRKERHARMVEMGLVKKEWQPDGPDAPAWTELDEAKQDEMDLRMATYAAQVDRMDQNIGRLMAALEGAGKLENTLVMFLSDNGACQEGGELGGGKAADINRKDGPLFVTVGQAWAHASNTPYRRYKHYVHEGGISTPLIVHWPAGLKYGGGRMTDAPGYLPDIMATCVEAGEATYPRYYQNYRIPPLVGKSLLEVFRTGRRDGHEYMCWEHEGHGAIRWGKWKAIQDELGTWQWELYDVEADRTEQYDLAMDRPGLVKELSEKWYEWAWEHKVFPKHPDGIGPYETY